MQLEHIPATTMKTAPLILDPPAAPPLPPPVVPGVAKMIRTQPKPKPTLAEERERLKGRVRSRLSKRQRQIVDAVDLDAQEGYLAKKVPANPSRLLTFSQANTQYPTVAAFKEIFGTHYCKICFNFPPNFRCSSRPNSSR